LPSESSIPEWAQGGELTAIIRTTNEVSIVWADSYVPEGVQSERGWRAFEVAGPLDFSLIGVLADLSRVLAEA